ncbi:MAG: hypothetical protein HY391_01460, partial [Deltaproteobacteria bacterium]|nr:hypothetical protein [Deltaproteobacteria bacterium]
MDRYRRSQRIDAASRWIISGGGIFVILSVFALLLFLIWEAAPLFKKPQLLARPVPSALSQENKVRWIGMDEYRKRAYLLYESGHIVVFHLATGKRLLEKRLVDEP